MPTILKDSHLSLLVVAQSQNYMLFMTHMLSVFIVTYAL